MPIPLSQYMCYAWTLYAPDGTLMSLPFLSPIAAKIWAHTKRLDGLRCVREVWRGDTLAELHGLSRDEVLDHYSITRP
jgi:hypothetical protein